MARYSMVLFFFAGFSVVVILLPCSFIGRYVKIHLEVVDEEGMNHYGHRAIKVYESEILVLDKEKSRDQHANSIHPKRDGLWLVYR
ncbi:hypothetical protein SAMN05216378_4985 [Paenibacillus catalpae]|uniref:Uncharacterized protein n=1 Tax=Paenibacillus catalpae TaxID=1045775 RepID=A0A1I2FRQ2_9BACL|nr:hypothetical protein SAMN05216378_4985 [Paenibacillus catalpae]